MLQQPAYLRLSISSDGSGTKDTTLNFEPADNADQGPVQNGVWQRWNAFDGEFRVVEGPGEKADSLITLAAYMTRHKDATTASGIGPDRSYTFEPAYNVPTVRSR